MPDLTELSPPQYAGPESRAAQNRAIESFRENNGAGFLGTLSAASSLTIPAATVRYADRTFGAPYDPNWQLTDRRLKELTSDIDRDLWPLFAESLSDEHANQIRSQLLTVMDDRKAIGAAGGWGTAAAIGASVLDPVFLAAGLATGGGATAARGVSLTNLVRGGLITGGVFAGLEGVRAGLEPTEGAARNALQAGVSGFVLHGVGGPLANAGRFTRAFATSSAAGVSSLLVDAAYATATGNDPHGMWENAATQWAMTGILSAIHGNAPVGESMSKAGDRAIRDRQYVAAQEAGASPTAKGQRYFAEQVDPSSRVASEAGHVISDIVADLDGMNVQQIAIEAMYNQAEARLTAFGPDHKLSRSEVDAVLEGTGRKAGNQGWPTAEDMRGYLKAMRDQDLFGVTGEAPKTATDPANKVSQGQEKPVEGLGAASPGTIDTPPARKVRVDPDQFDFMDVHEAPPSMVKIGGVTISGGISERLATSDNRALNLIARIFGTDPLPAADGSPVVYSAPQQVKDVVTKRTATVEHTFDSLYAEHVKAAKGSGRDPLPYDKWRTEVTKATRRDPNTYSQDTTINRGADFLRTYVFKWGREFGAWHGVPGYESIAPEPTYVSRIANREAIDQHIRAFSEESLREQVAAAIIKGHNQKGQTITLQQSYDLADAWLRLANSDGQSAAARAEARIPMDETHAWTQGGQAFTIEDLFHNDAASLAELYTRHIVGASAAQAGFKRIGEALRPLGSTEPVNITSRQQLLDLLAQQHRNERPLGMSQSDASFARDLAMADALISRVEGRPLHGNGLLVRAGRIASNVTFVKYLSNITTGILNLTEMPGSFARYGMSAALRQFPSLKGMIEIVRSGKVTDQLGRDIQNSGIGVDRVTRRIRRGVTSDDDGINQEISNAEYWTARAARVASDVSGQSFGQDWMRTSVGKLVSQVIMDHALGGTRLSEKRLAAMGIDANSATWARVQQHLKDSATTTTGDLGHKLHDPQTGQWNRPDGTHDVEAVAMYRGAVSLATQQAIITPDASGYMLWMQHPLARLMLQFRLFAWSAWRGKLLYNLNMRDRGAVAETLMATASAAVGYTLATYLRSLGRADAEEYREKMLSSDAIARAAFGRASYSSLIPTIIDTGLQDIMGRDPLFAHGRSSGLAGGLVSGNPTLDWINSAGRSLGSLQAPFTDDYEFSKQDLENIRKGWFIPSLYGIQQVFQQLGNDLPERSTLN